VGGQVFNERKFIRKDKIIQGSQLTKMKANSQYKLLFNTAKLYSHTQPTPGWPSLHQGPTPLVRLASGLGKSIGLHQIYCSQQTTFNIECWLIQLGATLNDSSCSTTTCVYIYPGGMSSGSVDQVLHTVHVLATKLKALLSDLRVYMLITRFAFH